MSEGQPDQSVSPRGFQAAVEADNVVLSQQGLFKAVGTLGTGYNNPSLLEAALFTFAAIAMATWFLTTFRNKTEKEEAKGHHIKGNIGSAKGPLREHIQQVYSILLADSSKDVIEKVIHPNLKRAMQETTEKMDSSDATTSKVIEEKEAYAKMIREVIVTEFDHYCESTSCNGVGSKDQSGEGTEKGQQLISSSEGIEKEGKVEAIADKNVYKVMQKIVETMNIDVEAMNDEGKLALVQTCLQAINTENQSKELEISSSSLKLQGGMFKATLSQNTILEESNYLSEEKNTISMKKLAQIEKQNAMNEKQKDLVAFKASCADNLLGGLLIMVIAMLPRMANLKLMTIQALEKCQVQSTGLLLLDLLPMISVPFCFVRTMLMRVGGYAISFYIVVNILQYGALRNYQAAPVTCLFLIMGVFCGQIGKKAICALGGNGEAWFCLWLLLCISHCMVLLFSDTVLAWLNRRADTKRYPSIRKIVFHVFLLFILPVAAGALPFIM